MCVCVFFFSNMLVRIYSRRRSSISSRPKSSSSRSSSCTSYICDFDGGGMWSRRYTLLIEFVCTGICPRYYVQDLTAVAQQYSLSKKTKKTKQKREKKSPTANVRSRVSSKVSFASCVQQELPALYHEKTEIGLRLSFVFRCEYSGRARNHSFLC